MMHLDRQDPGRLRVGVVVDSYHNVSAWIASVIEDLTAADFLTIVVKLIAFPEQAPGKNSRRDWLFRKYTHWDGRRVAPAQDPLRSVAISDLLIGVPDLQNPERGGMDELRGLNLDVLIWLASPEPGHAVRTVARYGVWRYSQADDRAYFWELYRRNPVSASGLEVLQEERTALLYEGVSSTEQGWSLRQNQVVPHWRASNFLLRCLRQLHKKGHLPPVEWQVHSPAPSPFPTNLQMTGFLLRNVARTATRRMRYANKESYWFVAYRTEQSKFLSRTEEIDLRGFQKIPAPEGHFYADPFPIQWKGQDYLFVEDYLISDQRGCISVMEIETHGVTSEAERVLDLPYHLSYPFVFEHNGDLWMIPETLGAGRIELYRASSGLTKWTFVKSLKDDVQAVDTTLWIDNGRYYFFTNIAERGSTVNDELFLFYADDLLGEWTAHPQNPICTDVRRSRGAGKLFRRNGRLIRPAQDCSVRYGFACQLNEIEVLTPTEYRERPAGRIEPDWYPGLIGTHTINSNDAIEVIDGQVYSRKQAAKKR